jgi:hypothetical protein
MIDDIEGGHFSHIGEYYAEISQNSRSIQYFIASADIRYLMDLEGES